MRTSKLISAIVVGVTLIGGCARSGAPLTVPLVHRPSRVLTGPQVIQSHVRVKVVDERVKKDAIGQNIEHSAPLPILSSDDPAAYLKGVLTQNLQMRGGIIDEERASREVVLHLVTFWVDESATYRAQVIGRAEVLDGRGKKLWEGMVGGTGSSWGRSLNPTNYQEAISDASTTMANQLLSDPQVIKALTE